MKPFPALQFIGIERVMSEGGRKLVLVVDDEPLVCWTLSRALVKAGFEVSMVGTGIEAFSELDSRDYDLLITDMRLPVKDGFEVAQHAREVHPGIPVIMISTYGNDEVRARVTENCIDCYMDKPFNLDEVVAQTESLLAN